MIILSKEDWERKERDEFIKGVSNIYSYVDSKDPRFRYINIKRLHIKKVVHLIYALLSPYDGSTRMVIIDKLKELFREERKCSKCGNLTLDEICPECGNSII